MILNLGAFSVALHPFGGGVRAQAEVNDLIDTISVLNVIVDSLCNECESLESQLERSEVMLHSAEEMLRKKNKRIDELLAANSEYRERFIASDNKLREFLQASAGPVTVGV